MDQAQGRFTRLSEGLIFCFFFVIFALIICRVGFTGAVLFTTDANIGHLSIWASHLPAGFFGGWSDNPLFGFPDTSAVNWFDLNLWLLPTRFFTNWMYTIDLILSSLFLAGFLRLRRCGLPACLLAALAAFWLGSNFSLIYAGHIGKAGVILFASVALFCIEKTAQTRRISWAVLTGGALGGMFTEQPDVALFMALMPGSYLLFRLRCPCKKQYGQALLKLFLPALIAALLIASHALFSGYQQSVRGIAAVQESAQEKWEFCTQWSWPPEESIDFIAPGYTGWRSGEPEGPYWGRMGRSAGWESTRQGFMNFKLENTYIGFIPIAFALFALVSCRRSPQRAEILFWGGATLVALLLAFGKYFPLYNIFWHLPVVNNIRNPNKFLQVFQLGLGILTAYGVDALFSQKSEGLKVESRKSTKTDLRPLTPDPGLPASALRIFFWFTAAVMGLLMLWALGTSLNQTDIAAGFSSQGWPTEAAQSIVANQSQALWYAVFMAGVTTAVFAIYSFKRFENVRTKSAVIAAGLVLIVAVDAVILSKNYIKTLPQGYIEENAVTRLLKEQPGLQRTATVTQDGFYNIWLTYLFPYQKIAAFNITQMPRMPQDYKQFLGTVGRNPLRMWQLSGVGFLLGPSGVEKQLPADRYQPVLRYDVLAGSDGNLVVRPNEKGSQTVVRSLAPAPRYALIGGCEKMNDASALAKLGSNDWKLFDKIILPLESSAADPGGHGFCGQVEVLKYRPGRILLKVQADFPGFLRAADKYDPDWKAQVDGVSAEVLRADFIFQAVYVPAGVHEVELKYSPDNKLLWLQLAGMTICAGSAVSLVFPRKKKNA